MADEEDLALARSGGKDLVRAVLDSADLNDAILAYADFSDANLERAKLRGATLDGAKLISANMAMADMSRASLREADLSSSSVFRVDFSGADLSGAIFRRSLMTGCNFTGANLGGADFSEATVNEDCTFTGVVVNRSTNFEGLNIARPLARLPAFSDYTLERGRLRRKSDASQGLAGDHLIAEAIAGIGAIIQKFSQVPVRDDGMIGHNNPPEEFTLTSEERREFLERLLETQRSLSQGSATRAVIENGIAAMRSAGAKVARYVALKADIIATEFSKSAGATLGSKTAAVIGTLWLTDSIANGIKWLEIAGKALGLMP